MTPGVCAYTRVLAGTAEQLDTMARICGFVQDRTAAPTGREFHGIWDTGATNTVISLRAAKELALVPVRYAMIGTASHPMECPLQYVTMLLPGDIRIANILVVAMPLTDIDFMLGMDIIRQGDFAVTHAGGQTKYSFQMPSTLDIDFCRS